MKRRITLLFTLLALLAFNASAQYTSDGLYTIECVGTSKYMTDPGSVGIPMPMTTPAGATTQFYIVENTATPGMYNIITTNLLYLAASTGSDAKLIENTEANRNSATSGALIDLIDQGANPYRIESTSAVGLRAWNGQRSTNTLVGMGTTASTKYQWNLVRIGDMPGNGPVVSVVKPGAGESVEPGASVLLQASAIAEDGETIASVEFLVDDVKVGDGVENGGVYEYTWTAPATEKAYDITAKATSSASAATTSIAVSLDVASIPVATALINPSDGQKAAVNKVISLTASANAATGNTITSVEFFEGANLLGAGSLVGDNYVYDWTPTVAATYSITSKVTDSGAETATSAAASLEVVVARANPVKSIQIDFEDVLAEDWMNESDTKATLSIENKGIGGSKALAISQTVGGAAHAYSTRAADMVYVEAGDNVYIIASVATSDVTSGKASLSFRTDAWAGPTPTNVLLTGVANEEFKTMSFGRNPNGEYFVDFSPRSRTDIAGAASVIYYDNMVLYAHSSASVDLTAPEQATNFEYGTVKSGSIEFSWTEGTDAETEITKTVILRKTTGASAPILLNQAAYKMNDVVGDWTVVAVLDAGTSFYADHSVADGTDYTYAVVHRDLAYNYSTPTVSGAIITSVNENFETSFNTYGVVGAIQINALTVGDNLEVYNLAGAKVFSKTISSSNLTVNVPQGIYMVRVAGAVTKVVVR